MTDAREIAQTPPRDAASRSSLAPGAVFSDRYRLLRRLGSGGMAEVYEVEHLLTKRRLALKLLHPESLANPTSVERFYREASACANIDSDHIVQIIDCDVDKSSQIPFLVMELLQGEDLARYIERQWEEGAGIPPSTVTALLKQVASALDKVHAQGIVHRDLKPANLFVTFPDDGPPRVKILDFGIAAHLHAGDGAKRSGRVGTPLYMAAEQITNAAPISPRTDVTAVALIAYEMLVGQAYWHGLSAAAIFARVPDASTHTVPSVGASRRGVNVPPGFDAWMLRCLDPDPSLRPISVSVAVGELMRVYDPRATQPPFAAAPPAGIRRATPPTSAPSPVRTPVPSPRAPSLHRSDPGAAPARRLVPRASNSSRPPPADPTPTLSVDDEIAEASPIPLSSPPKPPIAPRTAPPPAQRASLPIPPPRVSMSASPPQSAPPPTPPAARVSSPPLADPSTSAPAPDAPDESPSSTLPELVASPTVSEPESDVSATRPRKVRSRLRRPVDDPDEALYSAPTRKLPAFRMPGESEQPPPISIEGGPPPYRAPSEAAPESADPLVPQGDLSPHGEVSPGDPVNAEAASSESTPVEDDDAAPALEPAPPADLAALFEAPPAAMAEIDHEAETPISPPLEPSLYEPSPPAPALDSLSANVDAALTAPDPPARTRRVPKTLERAKTLVLPVFEARPTVPAWLLGLATAGTLILATTAAWVLLRDRTPRPAAVVAPRAWRGPSAAEKSALSPVTSALANALLQRRSATGFGESPETTSSGLDTARSLTALLAAHRAGGAMSPSDQLAVLLSLDRARINGHWTERDGSLAVGSVEATAWALIAYSRLSVITRAETARARVRVARDALLAAQRDDGSFPHLPDPTHVTAARDSVLATWALVESAESADPASVSAARNKALGWVRAAVDDPSSPVVRHAALSAQVGYLLARSHPDGAVSEGDRERIGRLARLLNDWCAPTPATQFECARPPGDEGTGVDPWRAWYWLALDRWSRDGLLGARDDAQATRVIRAGIARLASEQAELSRRPTEVLAVYVLAAASLRGD